MRRPPRPFVLVALSVVVAACGRVDTNPPVTAASTIEAPGRSPVASTLTLRIDACRVLQGCVAYGSIDREGGPRGVETILAGVGEAQASGLPATLEPGSYVVHFRFVTLSDEIVTGQQPEELPFAACDARIKASGNHLAEQIDLVVSFDGPSCIVTQGSRIADT